MSGEAYAVQPGDIVELHGEWLEIMEPLDDDDDALLMRSDVVKAWDVQDFPRYRVTMRYSDEYLRENVKRVMRVVWQRPVQRP